jgi:tetratricopeptide (TPR) repeat protein
MGGEKENGRIHDLARLHVWRSAMDALRRCGVPLGIAALCLTGVVLTYPYLSSLWHLERGGTALDLALGEIDSLNWWYVGPAAVHDSQALQRAVEHLEKATRHASALRLLGRAHTAHGNLLAGIEALEQFAQVRPENAMGHLELAAAYARADRRLQGMHLSSLLETLPGAAVSAPDLPGETHYRPEDWHSDYVYPTAFFLPPDRDERPTLFLHAGSQVTYTLSLTRPAVLRFGMGLDPRSLGWGGDGVTFEVFVDGARVFLEHLPVDVARGGWQERQVDLAAYAGRTVALSLASTPGPVGDVTADWAGWGDPRVEATAAAAYRQVVRGGPWRREWAAAGVTAEDFVLAGDGDREAEQYDSALTWYEWATRLDPDLGDPWYYVGLLYEDQERWDEALDAYERAIASDRLGQVHQSSPHYRIGVIYQWRLDPQQVDAASDSYALALHADDFENEHQAADCHYRYGEVLRWSRASPDVYITQFRRAVEITPRHASAYILLGVSIYERDGDIDSAERYLSTALEIDPRNKWAYYYLGDVYHQDGRGDQAKQMYKEALAIDPKFEPARKQLLALDGENKSHH